MTKLTSTVHIRLTDDERALLRQYAQGLRVSEAEAIRIAIRVLACYPKIRAEVAMRDLLDRQREI